MAGIVRAELYRVLHRWPTWLAAVLTVLALGVDVVAYKANAWGGIRPPDFWNAYSAFISAAGAGFSAFYPIVVPFIAVLPAADSFAIDWRSGAMSSMVVRSSWHAYILGKALVSAVATGALVFAAGIVSFIFPVGMFPTALPHLLGQVEPPRATIAMLREGVWANTYQPPNMPTLLWHHPFLLVVVVCLLMGLAAAALATVGLACSRIVTNRYLALSAPVILYIGVTLAVSYTVGPAAWQPYTFGGAYLGQYRPPSLGFVTMFWTGVLVAAGLVAVYWPRREMGA